MGPLNEKIGKVSDGGAEVVASGLAPRRLAPEEIRGLAHRIAAGDRAARDILIQANLGLVWRAARQYAGRGLAFEDLVGEGSLGLVRASEAFRPELGAQFSTYAMYWIKQAVLLALENTSIVRVPAHMGRLLNHWRRAERKLDRELGRPPSGEEVARELGLTQRQRELLEKARRARNVREEGASSEGGRSWSTMVAADPGTPPEMIVERSEEQDQMRDRLQRLGGRERRVMTLRYGLEGERPLNHCEISKRIGASREWSRNAERRALRRLADDAPSPRQSCRAPDTSHAAAFTKAPNSLHPHRLTCRPRRRSLANRRPQRDENLTSGRAPRTQGPQTSTAARGAA